ncbi:MAG TPA: YafY family protein [Sphingomonas sp.]|nr:YafY family protein [Sphingomonas sp.]
MLSAGWGGIQRIMRRADRLFQIIQVMRRTRRPVTADAIAAELEVSKRTVYRDVADLIGQHVPIRGEAGIGYVLDGDFDMPPLMLTPDEIEAAVLGAQWVAARGDTVLAQAARDLVAKIEAAVPERLRPFVEEPASGSPPRRVSEPDRVDMAKVRAAIHGGCKMHISYRDEQGRTSERTIWPVMIGYFETVRMLAAWCELRQDFRHFRIDRLASADFTEERFPARRADLRNCWRRTLAMKHRTEVAPALHR